MEEAFYDFAQFARQQMDLQHEVHGKSWSMATPSRLLRVRTLIEESLAQLVVCEHSQSQKFESAIGSTCRANTGPVASADSVFALHSGGWDFAAGLVGLVYRMNLWEFRVVHPPSCENADVVLPAQVLLKGFGACWFLRAERSWRNIAGLFATIGLGQQAAHERGSLSRCVKVDSWAGGIDSEYRCSRESLASNRFPAWLCRVRWLRAARRPPGLEGFRLSVQSDAAAIRDF